MNTTINEESIYQNCHLEEVNIEELTILETHFRQEEKDPTTLEELIKKEGCIRPLSICVSDNGDKKIIDGARTFKILRKLGIKKVQCINHGKIPLDRATCLSFWINSQQEPPSHYEKALHLRLIMERFGYTYQEIEMKGYGSTATTSHCLSFLTLPSSVIDLYKKKLLSFYSCIELLKLRDSELIEMVAKKAAEKKWSAKQIRLQISQLLDKENMTIKEPSQATESEIIGVTFKDLTDTSKIKDETIQLSIINTSRQSGKDYNNTNSYNDYLASIDLSLKEASRVTAKGCTVVLVTNVIPDFKGNKGRNISEQCELSFSKCQPIARKYSLFPQGVVVLGNKQSSHQDGQPDKARHTGNKFHDTLRILSIYEKGGYRNFPSNKDDQKNLLSVEEINTYYSPVWMLDFSEIIDEKREPLPDEAIMRLIKMYTYEEEAVLDLQLGNNNTIKIARELGRQAYGYEHEEQYKEVIMKKLVIEPAPETNSMVDYVKQSLDLNKPVATDSLLEHSAESKSCKPRFICNEGLADGLLTRI